MWWVYATKDGVAAFNGQGKVVRVVVSEGRKYFGELGSSILIDKTLKTYRQ